MVCKVITKETEGPVVVLVHGTFAPCAKWTRPDSALCRQLQAELHPTFVIFDWSGKNTNRARIKAGRDLSILLRDLLNKYPKSPINVIGHSHAGNIALYAVRNIDSSRIAIITIGTPFISCSPRNLILPLLILSIGMHFLVGAVLAAMSILAIGFIFEVWLFVPNFSRALELERLSSFLFGLFLVMIGAPLGIWYFHVSEGMACGKGATLVTNEFIDIGVQLKKQHNQVGLTLAARAPPKTNLLCLYTARDEALTGLRAVDILGEIGTLVNFFWLMLVIIALAAFFCIVVLLIVVARRPALLHFLEQWFPWMTISWVFSQWEWAVIALGTLALAPLIFLFSPLILIIMATIRRLGYWDDMAIVYLHTKLWSSPYPMSDEAPTEGVRCYHKCAETSNQSWFRVFRPLRHSQLLESAESVDYITKWISSRISQR